jgi:pyruvate dehydrogenase (quinone)
MSTTTAEFTLSRLADDWGIKRIYGYPGDGINGLTGAFHEVGDRIEFVQVRHEEIAAFAACAHAKLTGEVGVCMATSGPGAIHLLNGLYDAKLDHQPVLAIVGQQARFSIGSDYQQEVDLQSLFKDVAGAYVQTCNVPEQAPHLIDRAMRIAKATRSPTCLIFPNDVQELPFEEPPREHGCARPPMSSTAGSGSRCWSARERRVPSARSSRLPTCWARAPRRRSTGGPYCPMGCRGSPARSGCSARNPPTT